jgi:hypothetical protein
VSYVTWFDGESKFNYRLRQCASCSSEFRNGVMEPADWKNGDGDWERSDLVLAAPKVATLRRQAG